MTVLPGVHPGELKQRCAISVTSYTYTIARFLAFDLEKNVFRLSGSRFAEVDLKLVGRKRNLKNDLYFMSKAFDFSPSCVFIQYIYVRSTSHPEHSLQLGIDHERVTHTV